MAARSVLPAAGPARTATRGLAALPPAAAAAPRRLQPRLWWRQRGAAQRLAAAAVETPVAACGGIEIEDIVYADGSFTVQGCLLSRASPDTVYQVLTDYEALPRVFHNIDSSAVRHCEQTGGKQLVQTCKWAFLVFSGTFVTELSVREDVVRRQLTFSLLESAFMREFVGSWDIRPAPGSDHGDHNSSSSGGASISNNGSGLTEVRHRLSVCPAVAPPQAVGDISKRIFQRQVVGILSDLQAELDARM